MWQRNALLLALGLSLSPRAESLGEEIPGSKRLLAKTNWVSCDLAMGHLVVLSHRAKQDQPRIQRTWPDGTEESFRVTLDRGLVSLHYSCCSAAEQMVIHVTRRDHVDLEHARVSPTQETTHVRFVQEPNQPLRLTVQTGESPPIEYTAESLWHLLLIHPAVCRTHLFELLRTLMPNRNLDAEGNELRARLLAGDMSHQFVSRQQVADLVAQTADDAFRVRQHAARELRGLGHAALAFLDDREHASLDAEQRWRMRSIRESIVANLTDTPGRLAVWLVNDESIWLALLNDEEESCRALATAQLARLCNPQSVPPPDVGGQVNLRLR